MVQACTIIKISVHIWCRKTVILEISECEKRVFWQSVASDHSRNVNGNELVNFNLVQKKIIHFIKKILEVRASVIITDGTICTTAFVTYSQIQYNSIILFNYCMVLYCTHRSLGDVWLQYWWLFNYVDQSINLFCSSAFYALYEGDFY